MPAPLTLAAARFRAWCFSAVLALTALLPPATAAPPPPSPPPSPTPP
jgi:hypothetical protein